MAKNHEFQEKNEKEKIINNEKNTPTSNQLDGDTISSIQGQNAHKAAEDALSENDLPRGYSDARRYSSEAAARFTAGNDSVDLDNITKVNELGFKGNNYPIYDISSPEEVASVKTHWNSEGYLDKNAISAYKRDFAKLYGWNRNVNALHEDGENIIKIRNAGLSVPHELENATIEEASEYLRDNSLLRIPDDHVDQIRSELEVDIRNFPTSYSLSENPTDEQIKHVLERVKGIGLKSNELKEMVEIRMKEEKF